MIFDLFHKKTEFVSGPSVSGEREEESAPSHGVEVSFAGFSALRFAIGRLHATLFLFRRRHFSTEADVTMNEEMYGRKKHLLILLSLGVCILLILAACAACCVCARFGELPGESEQRRFSLLPNYSSRGFVNREPAGRPSIKTASSAGFFRFLFTSPNAPDFELPRVPLNRNSFSAEPGVFEVFWLGHSSLIFELASVRFMTDPVFGNAAPLPGIVRRYCEPPLPRTELPELDFILISHDHYDHLEYATIRALRNAGIHFITPLGVGARLRGWGIAPERIHELNWGESTQFAGLKVTALCARHFSGRSTSDRNRTLWAAFLIEGGGKRIFFGADGGYGAHFREIGDQHGPIDLVCLEIDAWNERWPNNHLFPDEVIRAFLDLKGRTLLPIHWGVFDLAMHPWDESIRKVMEHAQKAGIRIMTPKMGEKTLPESSGTGIWWK